MHSKQRRDEEGIAGERECRECGAFRWIGDPYCDKCRPVEEDGVLVEHELQEAA